MDQPVKTQYLSYSQSRTLLLDLLKNKTFNLETNKKRTILIGYKESKKMFQFHLPPIFHYIDDSLLQNPSIPEDPENYYIILIQAGHSALAYCENGMILLHKVITKYMVRKGQGKAQISYLKTKGKSRAGSRIRLAKSIEFFEEINDKLTDWFKEKGDAKILYSCPVTLWPLLFDSKISPPFKKKGDHLIRIPLDVNKPCFSELQRINPVLSRGQIEIYEVLL
ncbi:MAG: hypothetical protein IEMM0008_0728 [bacterium]|nr:MAG: hypothetical protein IEMM0008_0728 [bacterium]